MLMHKDDEREGEQWNSWKASNFVFSCVLLFWLFCLNHCMSKDVVKRVWKFFCVVGKYSFKQVTVTLDVTPFWIILFLQYHRTPHSKSLVSLMKEKNLYRNKNKHLKKLDPNHEYFQNHVISYVCNILIQNNRKTPYILLVK